MTTKPLPPPFVSFFAGAVANVFVDGVVARLDRGGVFDNDKLTGIVPLARRIATTMQNDPRPLAILGQKPTAEDWIAVDAFVVALEAHNIDAGNEAITARFARAALERSRDRFEISLAGVLLVEGGYRVD